jgi:aminoglycoside phosphotransferase (APT) family kinase protein
LRRALKELHSHNPDPIDFDWREFLQIQVESAIDKQKRRAAIRNWIERACQHILEKYLHLIPDRTADAFQHGDVHFGNLRFEQKNGVWRNCGLF